MVHDQTANQAAKPLKKGEKNNHQFWNSNFEVLVVLMLLRKVWIPLVATQVGAWWSSYLENL
jgi:hypothetical protein